MPVQSIALYSFNRGIVSPLALARVDQERLALAAETMTNWVPRTLGSMMLRPGWQYLGSSASDAKARYLPFVFSTDDTALIELTNNLMRVWVDDALVTRPSVTTAVTNGNFDTNLTGWNSADEAGAQSAWGPGGYMFLSGDETETKAAKRWQLVIVSGGNIGVQHALRIVINRGPVVLRVGSTSGGDEYIHEVALDAGTHSLAFTPTGNFYIEFSSRLRRKTIVDSCNIEAAGVLTLPTQWAEADLAKIRHDQSGDVVFVACDGYQQRRIERRANNSWSLVQYLADDGPFRIPNLGTTTLTPSFTLGDIAVTSSVPLFRAEHNGALFRITTFGQKILLGIGEENKFTDAIKVTGSGTQRAFTINISGTFVATLTLQRSLESDAGTWVDVTTYTTPQTISYNDGLDNQEAWYRIGVKTGNYTSGSIVVTMIYSYGSVDGVVRITGIASSTEASAGVITRLGNYGVPTEDWAEGEWSDYRGYPTAVGFHEGRLFWSGLNRVWGSVSDDYHSFDPEYEGDAGPISRTIGSGPVDTINWLLSLQRLIVGAEGSEQVCKSSSLDTPLTNTDFSMKQASGYGSAQVEAVKLDKTGIYVQRGGTRVMLIAIGSDGEYGSTDLTVLVPEICESGAVRIAVQRKPDTRLHCVLADGTVAMMVFDDLENTIAWLKLETDGFVEDAVVIPGSGTYAEDAVYYHVNRTINGATKRYLEKWAIESECRGETLNKQADSFITYSGVATATITGLDHIEGETVIVWGGGKDIGSYTVTGGQITGLSEAVTSAVIGLPYTAQWKSAKLAYASGLGTALLQKKRLSHLGVILANTHAQGLKYGPSFDYMDDLPLMESGAEVGADTVHTSYDEEMFEFPGEWDTDSRLCLQAQAPRPCTILAAVLPVETHDKH